MLKVKDIMTKDVITVTMETTVLELARIFAEKHISSLPVVDDAGSLAGIVTETDLVERDKSLHIPTVISIFDWVIYLESDKKFEKELKKMTGKRVADIYSTDVVTVSPDDTVAKVADIMSSRRVNALPVVEAGKVIGIVARIDLIRAMI
ncbi:MAG: domain containing rane protein [Deltaproteobacteria bacterium]|nr:domain containing rane protein [Deltaproteobacteria bacterium]